MATNEQPPASSSVETSSLDSTEPWTTTQLETALASLERLQEQLDSLRSTIPDLVHPLKASALTSTSSGSAEERKAAIFTAVRREAGKKGEELAGFRRAWEGEEVKELFERCRESVKGDADLGRSVEVERWGWVERVEGRKG